MKKLIYLIFPFVFSAHAIFSQSIDDSFSRKKMRKDLEVFKKIRIKANSGLYKYRSKAQIDSIYHWAEKEIESSNTYRDFCNIIYQLTDFEGSTHNWTSFSSKMWESLKEEEKGYFPFPIKLINGKVILNFETNKIPLGAELISINNQEIEEVIPNLYKYYTTDGLNITGKSIGVNYNFSGYYRLHYGLMDAFKISYKTQDSNEVFQTTLESVSSANYYKNVENRYSKPFDEPHYKDWEENEIYTYKNVDHSTGILTINTFGIGNETTPEHKRFANFLDSIFVNINKEKIENLIVDVRYNGGGTDPNDLVTYSYLTQRNFSENKQAWISFEKIPYLKYLESNVPSFLRPLGVGKYNRLIQKEFPTEKDSGFFQNSTSSDHKVWTPNKNAFKGKIYLLISPRVASAGSLFAAMVAGNQNTVVIGEETMGGYYGHNGHTSMTYILPKSKIK
ncbi:S41 family peptidase, partial [Xanthovirga aplysinae]|uniref:S41 family peptidase n=1 Tax=Xanthovirga aplysinae TaxID=2529853 RepID=UPI0012BC1D2D